jgi:hypothetical protein
MTSHGGTAWALTEQARRPLVHVAAPPLGLEGPLVLHVGGVTVDHRPILPSHEPHQVPL